MGRIEFVSKLLSAVLYLTGTATLAKHVNRLRLRVPILMYHSISEEKTKDYKTYFDLIGMSVSKENFEKHMAYIACSYNVIGLDVFIQYLRGEKDIPPNSIILTFDDGLRNNHDVALPILKKYGFTATFFLIGNSMNGLEGVWLHLLYEILDELTGKRVTWIYKDCVVFKTDRLDPEEKLVLGATVKTKLAGLPSQKPHSVLKEICRQNGVKYEDICKRKIFMTPEEIAVLLANGNLIGAHSMSHNRLSGFSPQKKREEIYTSRDVAKQFCTNDLIPFSYPHGTRNSYDGETKNLVEDSGMCCAVTTIEGLNSARSDPFELNRIEIGDFGRMEFVSHLSGVIGDIKIILKRILKRD